MNRCRCFVVSAAIVLVMGLTAPAEVRTVVGHNESDRATAEFRFDDVPSPSKGAAAAGATFTVVDGRRDENGGDADVLNDGKLPGEADQPDANFFFAPGTDGGRLLMDLGKSVDVKRVCTYSWHPGSRAPQVYTLYAGDGAVPGFNPRPRKGTDPTTCGWKRLAAVDTRPKEGDPGGQYGVSISDPAGNLGTFRYLLFDVSRTESRDRFGNTFYSEIDVVDAHELLADAPASRPATREAGGATKYEITIDTSEVPELKDWADHKLKPVLDKWYPILVKSLPSDGYTAPRRFTVTFKKDMKGVAYTAGTSVVCAADWFKQNLEGEAVGAVVHELVHVVQQYHHRGNPGWLVEGIADYYRWFKYEPPSQRPRPNPARARYTDSYRTTAAFLNYVTETDDKDIVVRLNAAMRQGKYKPELWKEYTGKTVDELWDEYVETLKKRR